MKRVETYVGQQVYEWLFSAQAQNEMVGLGKLSAAMLGTNVIANGLACTPNSPAGLNVLIGAGELYQMENLEATICGTLPANTANQILKQGIQLGTYTTATLAAPTTSGQSINYLIEAQYQDSDISIDPTTGNAPVVLQFYNAGNPSTPWSGPNNSGATSNTFRDGVIAYQIKAGTPAATGTQVTPTPDTNWTGLWVVTVAYGQTQITAPSITQYPGAPILPSGLLQSIITGNLNYGIDNGAANAIQATFPIPVTTLTDGMFCWVKVKNPNSGATTFTPNPGVIAPSPVVGAAHAALQGSEYIANGRALYVWRADISSWVLAFCTGGAEQIATATQSQHAVQFGQVAGIVGSARNARMYVSAASASATFTADEMTVETALGGLRYCLANYSQTVNLGGVWTSGTPGMDTGSAPTNGYVALYAIYNPTTNTQSILATNATSSVAPSIYAGGHMPAGYTASALISVWPTNASGQFKPGLQIDRSLSFPLATAYTTSSIVSSFSAISLSAIIPLNARSITGELAAASTLSSNLSISVAADTLGTGQQNFTQTGLGGADNYALNLATQQAIYLITSSSAGSPTFTAYISGYSF